LEADDIKKSELTTRRTALVFTETARKDPIYYLHVLHFKTWHVPARNQKSNESKFLAAYKIRQTSIVFPFTT